MKILFFLILNMNLLFSSEIEVIPEAKNVGINETFGVIVKVEVQGDEEPEIKISGLGLDILDKEQQGVSSSTTIINGSVSSKKQFTYRYELKAKRIGQVSLRDIEVLVDGKRKVHPGVTFYVEKERKVEDRNIFVQAELSKSKVYQGEGILLRYYLYYKIQVANITVKKFPELNNFMKRFLQESNNKETFVMNGERYERRLMYSTVLFAEKIGNYKIDPLSIDVSYAVRDRSNPFGSFGFGGATSFRKASFGSETVRLEVLPLPSGAPTGFTGLVGGPHQFSLTFNRNKYLVNEPIELKFTVQGDGNLENYEVRGLIEDQAVESFENSANLLTSNSIQASKEFNLTYLPRSQKVIEARKIPFSYFDSEKKEYISKEISIPRIEIRGGAISSSSSSRSKLQKVGDVPGTTKEISLIGPYFASFSYPFLKRYHSLLNLAGLVLIFGLIALDIKKSWQLRERSNVDKMIEKVKKQKMSYGPMYTLLDNLEGENLSVFKKIESSELSSGAKAYFRRVLNSKENVIYGENKKISDLEFKKNYFHELKGILKQKHENLQQRTRT
jgi:hypothetical protein